MVQKIGQASNALLVVILASLCLACPIAWAETGILVLHVKDVQQHPVGGLQIGVEGDGGSGTTDPRGKARIKLAPQTMAKSWVSLQIEKSPPGKDWVMVSPWERKTLVPSFENESENFVEVVVVQRGDRAALESGTVLVAAVSQINKANAPKSADKQAAASGGPLTITRASLPNGIVGVPYSFTMAASGGTSPYTWSAEDPKANLDAVAKQYGLTSDDLDKAIRTWKTTDPYEAGLKALYASNYDAATSSLQDSLKQREEKFANARRMSPMLPSFWVRRYTSKASTGNRRPHISAAYKSGPTTRR
jgi:hypothetical protein